MADDVGAGRERRRGAVSCRPARPGGRARPPVIADLEAQQPVAAGQRRRPPGQPGRRDGAAVAQPPGHPQRAAMAGRRNRRRPAWLRAAVERSAPSGGRAAPPRGPAPPAGRRPAAPSRHPPRGPARPPDPRPARRSYRREQRPASPGPAPRMLRQPRACEPGACLAVMAPLSWCGRAGGGRLIRRARAAVAAGALRAGRRTWLPPATWSGWPPCSGRAGRPGRRDRGGPPARPGRSARRH